jgi:hypothetical protein
MILYSKTQDVMTVSLLETFIVTAKFKEDRTQFVGQYNSLHVICSGRNLGTPGYSTSNKLHDIPHPLKPKLV